MRRRWEVYRCWQGSGSTLVPQPTGRRYWRRRTAERMATRMTTSGFPPGMWFEVRSADRARVIDHPPSAQVSALLSREVVE